MLLVDPVQWVLLGFFTVFEIGSLLCAVATSSDMLIIARAVAGIGGSGLINGGMTILTASAPPERQPGEIEYQSPPTSH